MMYTYILLIFVERTPSIVKNQMEEFKLELRSLWESEKESNESSPDDILLFDNMNNCIPSNEIGLGCTLLKTDVTSKKNA